jgi:hypothetical protein
MHPNLLALKLIDWGGLAITFICAAICTLVTSTLIIAKEHYAFYSQASYHLEGGQAFSAHAEVNFLIFLSLVTSVIGFASYFSYCIIARDKGFTTYTAIAGILLFPSIFLFVTLISKIA